MPDEPNRQISPERKVAYYGGMACIVLGLLLFLSTFLMMGEEFSAPANPSGNFDQFFEESRRSHARAGERMQSSMARALGGMALIFVGCFLMNVGRRGLAGSGVVLDPEKARKDLEPWNRAAGGMASDALDEIELAKKLGKKLDEPEPAPASPPAPVVKVRCRKCTALNDERAKFCNQCGAAL